MKNLQTLVTSIFIGLSLVFGLINLNAKISLLSVLLFFILYTILNLQIKE